MNLLHVVMIILSVPFLLIGWFLSGISLSNSMKKWNNVIHGDTCYLLGLSSLLVGFILFAIGV